MGDFQELLEEMKSQWSEETLELFHQVSAENRHCIAERRSVGAALRAARKQAGLTQVQLAALSGIDQAEISRLERGLGNPTIDTLTQLGLYLGLRLGFTPAVPDSEEASTERTANAS